jgi:TonB-dependent receptor
MRCISPGRGPTKAWPAFAGLVLASLFVMQVRAEAAAAPEPEAQVQAASPNAEIEEVVVIGRYRAAATDVVAERIESEVAMDLLDAEGISRLGDSSVATALRRVPGVTVRDDKFVYVRGLGERYSSAQLNGAVVPSPDLTRDVLPLDIFPASIIDALAISKGYSPDLPAGFGGGNVDIRTKQIPESGVFTVALKSGLNTVSDKGFTYKGGSDDKWGEDDGTRALSPVLFQSLETYQGNISPANILTVLRRSSNTPTAAQSETINRQLATELNRNLDFKETDLDPDLEGEISGGYRWFFGDNLEVGFLAHGSYEKEQRQSDRINRRVVEPTLNFSETNKTVDAVNLTGSLNLGVRYTEDHQIGTLSMALRNTEDEVSDIVTCQDGQFNNCNAAQGAAQGRLFDIRYEARDLRLNQINGRHKLGDATLGLLPDFLGFLEKIRDTQFTWYYSDAIAESDIPGEVRFSLVEQLASPRGQVTTSQIRPTASSADYRFSELEDDVVSHGWELTVPLYLGDFDVTVLGGYDYVRKGRFYTQYSFGLGGSGTAFQTIAVGTPSEVFSDTNVLNTANNLRITAGTGGFGTESYLAGQIVDAVYVQADVLWNETWRVTAGARREDFQQLGVPVNLLEFTGSRIPLTTAEIEAAAQVTDGWYPSATLTWIRPEFWSDEFQLRLGYSQTVARPDIREVSRSTYIDPLTEARVRGNPFLQSSELKNYDIRAEWFWDAGDNASISLFYKDITQPIETIQGGATEENILFNFVNADSAEIYGIELEGLKSLDFASQWLGNWFQGFYVAGNLTVSDTDIKILPGPGVGNITNVSRRLTQHSKWVANMQLGYDSPDGKHGATLAYNSFGERILFAGIDGLDDAFEQPFNSLDLTYSWFPTEQITLKFRVRNLLDEKLEVVQQGVKIIEQEPGLTMLIDARWSI